MLMGGLESTNVVMNALQTIDCNPIEHMWDELGRRLRQRPHAPNTVDELSQALLEEWNNIQRRVHRNFCTSMTHRVQAVLNSNCGHTRY